jgi:hypothetical protein
VTLHGVMPAQVCAVHRAPLKAAALQLHCSTSNSSKHDPVARSHPGLCGAPSHNVSQADLLGAECRSMQSAIAGALDTAAAVAGAHRASAVRGAHERLRSHPGIAAGVAATVTGEELWRQLQSWDRTLRFTVLQRSSYPIIRSHVEAHNQRALCCRRQTACRGRFRSTSRQTGRRSLQGRATPPRSSSRRAASHPRSAQRSRSQAPQSAFLCHPAADTLV